MARKANDLFDIFNQQSELAAAEARKAARREEKRAQRGASKSVPASRTKAGKPPSKRSIQSSRTLRRTDKNGGGWFRNLMSAEGITLGGRQLLLTSAVGLLLLVLSFFVGLSHGRSGNQTDTLQRVDQRSGAGVMVHTWVSRIKQPSQKLLTSKELATSLMRIYKVQRNAIYSIRAKGNQLLIDIGPFRTQAEAERYIEKKRLKTADFNGRAAFRYPEFRPFRRR